MITFGTIEPRSVHSIEIDLYLIRVLGHGVCLCLVFVLILGLFTVLILVSILILVGFKHSPLFWSLFWFGIKFFLSLFIHHYQVLGNWKGIKNFTIQDCHNFEASLYLGRRARTTGSLSWQENENKFTTTLIEPRRSIRGLTDRWKLSSGNISNIVLSKI